MGYYTVTFKEKPQVLMVNLYKQSFSKEDNSKTLISLILSAINVIQSLHVKTNTPLTLASFS